jgi:hypothetical protein
MKTSPALVNSTPSEKEFAFSFPIPKDFPPSMFNDAATVTFLGKAINVEHRLVAHLTRSAKVEVLPINVIGTMPPPKPVSLSINTERTQIQVNLPTNSTGINGEIVGDIKVLRMVKPSTIKAALGFLISEENPNTPQPRPDSMVTISSDFELKKPVVGTTYKIRLEFDNFQRLFTKVIPGLLKFVGGMKLWVGGGLLTPHEYIFVPISTGVDSAKGLTYLLPRHEPVVDLKPFKSTIQLDPAVKLVQTASTVLDQAGATFFNEKVLKKKTGPQLWFNNSATILFG